MNAIEDNQYSLEWVRIGKSFPKPIAILCISAHWVTDSICVTGNQKPPTIHDFYGFPQALNRVEYPAPGSPDLAKKIKSATLVDDWGLDHGAWSVLCRMYPLADIPVVQLSLSQSLTPQQHFDLGRTLVILREQGVLIIGSGNIIHNLSTINMDNSDQKWALVFDKNIKDILDYRDYQPLVDYHNLVGSQLAIPTNEHYLPLLYVLGASNPKDKITYFNESITAGSIGMRSFILSAQP